MGNSLAFLGIPDSSSAGSVWSLVDAALFLLLAGGILGGSRYAAIAALVVYAIEQAQWSMSGLELNPVLIAMFAFAFANGIRGTFSRHRQRPQIRLLRVASAIGVVASIGLSILLVPAMFRYWTSSPYERVLSRRASELVSAVATNAPDVTADQMRDRTAGLTAAGFKRLQDDDVGTLLDMRVALVEQAGEPLCAQMLTGGSGPDYLRAFDGTIGRLPIPLQERLANLTVTSALAEANQVLPIRESPSEEEITAIFMALGEKLPATDFQQMLSAIQDPTALNNAQKCSAAKTLFRGLSQLPRPQAILVTRASFYE